MKNCMFIILLVWVLNAKAQFIAPFATIDVAEDSWVENLNPDSNYNNTRKMYCSNDKKNNHYSEIYLKFNIEEAPEFDSVSLDFLSLISLDKSLKNLKKEFHLQVIPINSKAWSEEQLTWTNKPLIDNPPVIDTTLKGSLYNSISSEKLKSYIKEAKNAGEKYISFAFVGKGKQTGKKLWVTDKGWGIATLNFYFNHKKDYEITFDPTGGHFNANKLEVELKSFNSSTIYYTLDGSVPDKTSLVYSRPIQLDSDAEITAMAVDDNETSYYFEQYYILEKKSPVKIQIDLNSDQKVMHNFWNATGFSPGEALLNSNMQQACKLAGSIPGEGLLYVRPHYMLNLVGTKDLGTNQPKYNWIRLDSAMDVLINNNLKPIFEIMGTPSSTLHDFSVKFDDGFQAQLSSHSSFFSNFHEKEKLYAWKRFIKDMALHFIERYGREEVRSWYFETCNEPDVTPKFWQHSLPEFINYYDACSEGLKEADPMIRFGGPGSDGNQYSRYLRELLAHCDTGINYFTGETGVRLDFISVHVKDMPHQMIEIEKNIYNYIIDQHPRFKDVPFVNDEADPVVGWAANYWWRPLPWYAAFIAQSADLHYQAFIDSMGISYAFLSNDNLFMGDWHKRTLFAQFPSNNNPDTFSLIKKPCFTVLSLLSQLGKTVIEADLPEDKTKHLGIIPTTHADGKIVATLYYKQEITFSRENPQKSSRDKLILEHGKESVNLEFTNLPLPEYLLVQHRIDENNGNPYKKWLEMGKPDIPSAQQLATLRTSQEPGIDTIQHVKVVEGKCTINIDMPASSVCNVMLLPKRNQLPGHPEILELESYRGLYGTENIISWNQVNEGDIMTYEVWFSEDNVKFKKINPSRIFDNAFIHALNKETLSGYYKVRAIDYQGRKGSFSKVIYYSIKDNYSCCSKPNYRNG